MPVDRRKNFLGIYALFQLSFWHFTILCLCFFLSHSPAEPSSCPTQCKCTFLQKTVNCSNRSLRKIPSLIPQDVVTLSFHNNKIAGTELQSKEFNHLTQLQTLDLSDNRLKEVNLTFPSRLPIKKLVFDRCILTEVPIISGADGLIELYLSHNSITNLTARLDGWPLLEELDLSFNKIRFLSNHTFQHLNQLRELDLSKNKISTIGPRAFVGLASLEALLMSRNRIRVLKNFTLCLAKECSDKFKNLRHLDLSRNQIVRIDALTFQYMHQLRTLILSRNNIILLRDGAFYNLRQLIALHLDNNKISKIVKEWLYDLTSLRNLSLSHNNVSIIEPEAWKFCVEIQHLNLSSNMLPRVRNNMFASLASLVSLDLSRNQISILEDLAFHDLSSLHELDLSSNLLSSTIEDLRGAFNGLSVVRSLNVSWNKIRFLSPPMFSGLTLVMHLDLTHNNITSIANYTFDQLKHLTQLRMDSSSLLCDCKLSSFASWMRSQTSTSNIALTCFHPPKLKGRELKEVDTDQLMCGEHPVPSLLKEPGDVTSNKGENVTLECSASATLPADGDSLAPSSVNMSAEWRRGPNKDEISESKSLRIRNLQRPEGTHLFFTSLLLLYDVGYHDEDRYSCCIKNDFGIVTSQSAHLSVVSPPRIVRIPQNKTVKYESEVVVDCQATGHPIPTISWERADGGKFAAADQHRLIISEHMMDDDVSLGKVDLTENVPLHIRPVELVDAGRYKCTANSTAGSHSAYVTIVVLYPPKIEGMPSVTRTAPGSTTVLKCMVSALPSPSIQWLLNNTTLQKTSRHFLAADKQLLVIVDSQVKDQGLYTCSVYNDLGMKRKTTELVLAEGDPSSGEGMWDSLWGLPGVLLIVSVCVLATSLVWLLYLCCSKRKDDDSKIIKTDSLLHCDGCQSCDLHHHHSSATDDMRTRAMVCSNRGPDLLPHGPACPRHGRGQFYSLPRDSRYDTGPSTRLWLSNSTEQLRARNAINLMANSQAHCQESSPLTSEVPEQQRRTAGARRMLRTQRDSSTSSERSSCSGASSGDEATLRSPADNPT